MVGYSSIINLIVIVFIGLFHAGRLSRDAGRRCGTGEWSCHGLGCIGLNKFCDGISHCPDGSDEPPGCTNCNRTYSGKAGIKYPLRVTGPFQRYLPFVCRVNFVAMGNDFGDLVELSFLSFQIGRFEFTKDLNAACRKGFLKIYEPPVSSLSEDVLRHPNFGNFCGKMTERSATFFSKSSNVTLLVVVPSRASIPSTSTFSLFLTFRFMVRTRTRNNPTFVSSQYGNPIPGTFCDRMFLNCNYRPCKIRSPNFPGFYPRNITCNYHIKQMMVPHANVASIVLEQANDYKIFLPRGSESSPSNTASTVGSKSALSTDCSGPFSDSMKIFDGPTTSMPLLAQFCGDGTMPKIISSGPELLVQLHSAPYSILCSSRLEIEVIVKFEPEIAGSMQKDRSRCAYVIDANRHRRWGIITSPKYTMPENSSCIYKFIGASSYDRIWIYFVSYLSREQQETLIEKEQKQSCKSSVLEMFDSDEQWSILDLNEDFDAYPMQFCGESLLPKICAHALDYPPLYSPGRPCFFPDESYYSSGPTFVIRHSFPSTINTVDFFNYNHFTARYEFVDTRQDGIAIGRTECDRRFDSRSAKGGFISNPKNVFFYGRGGRQNVSCAFHFVGLPSERVRITIFNVKLSISKSDTKCQTYFDSVTHKHLCFIPSEDNAGRIALIKGVEFWDSHSATIGCLCNITSLDKSTKYIFDSLVSNVKLIFAANFMSPLEDFKDFNFEAKFEFFNSTLCDTHAFDKRSDFSPEGTIEFHVPSGRTNFTSGEDISRPLRCRWEIKAVTEKYLYLQFRGTDSPPDNCKDGVWVLVYVDNYQSKPTSRVCIVSEDKFDIIATKEYHVFSHSWFNDTLNFDTNQKDFIFIEIVSDSNWKGIKLHFHWMEVTKPFYKSLAGTPLRNVDCVFECPDIGACIDPHFWCDGVDHCPSGFDELPSNCHTLSKGLEYLSVIVSMTAVVLLIAGLLIAWALVRHRHHHRSCVHEMNDSPKDCNHRLSPTEDYQMESPVS
ncbi:uncharacterized protein LOC129227460 [Uloborus diversus]|uniref:uncharacterized protein LOC129227460 n=1 Tax=Uloborus diversus TaxID=327109 RepID=UPI00240A5A2D|nr:uncharacterized protein LOC129227460 [Uloborus diversus]